MVRFTAETPRHEHKVLGVVVPIPHPYSDGHILSTSEARFLNAQLAAVVANGVYNEARAALGQLDDERAKAHKAKTYTGPMDEAGKKPAPATLADLGWDLETKIADRMAAMTPGESLRPSTTPIDPVAKIAWDIATRTVKDRLAAKGFSVRQAILARHEEHGNQLKALTVQALEKETWITEAAKAQYAAAQSAAETPQAQAA